MQVGNEVVSRMKAGSGSMLAVYMNDDNKESMVQILLISWFCPLSITTSNGDELLTANLHRGRGLSWWAV